MGRDLDVGEQHLPDMYSIPRLQKEKTGEEFSRPPEKTHRSPKHFKHT